MLTSTTIATPYATCFHEQGEFQESYIGFLEILLANLVMLAHFRTILFPDQYTCLGCGGAITQTGGRPAFSAVEPFLPSVLISLIGSG